MKARCGATLAIPVLLLLSSACRAPEQDAPADSQASEEHHEEEDGIVLTEEAVRAAGLQTTPVVLESFHPHLLASGVIRPDAERQVVVRARQAARVTAVLVDVGARVGTNALLARMEGPDASAALARFRSAAAREAAARQSLERARQLLDLAAISRAEHDHRAAEATAARAETAAARQDLSRMGLEPTAVEAGEALPSLPIRAPLSGTVLARHVSPGLAVVPDQALFEIAELSRLWVIADVHERDLGRVGRGAVEVRTEAFPDEEFTGEIGLIEPALDEQSRTAHVRVLLDNRDGRLRPGMFVTVAMPLLGGSDAPAAAIPVGAVQSVSGLPMVFIEETPGHYQVRPVETGQEAHGLIEIRRGLQPGDRVVTAGAFILKSELLKSTIGGDEH